MSKGIWVTTHSKLAAIERGIKEQLAKHEITLGIDEIHVLGELYKNDKQKPSALARSIDKPETSFTPTIDALEREELIMRQPHPLDRRAVLICLTAKGAMFKRTISTLLAEIELNYGSK